MDVDLTNNNEQYAARKGSMPATNQTERQEVEEFADNVREMSTAVNLFFNNQIEQAMALAASKSDHSLPHAHGIAMFKFFTAVLTMEPEEVEDTKREIKKTIAFCNRLRKMTTIRKSITSLFFKYDYNEYKERE